MHSTSHRSRGASRAQDFKRLLMEWAGHVNLKQSGVSQKQSGSLRSSGLIRQYGKAHSSYALPGFAATSGGPFIEEIQNILDGVEASDGFGPKVNLNGLWKNFHNLLLRAFPCSTSLAGVGCRRAVSWR